MSKIIPIAEGGSVNVSASIIVCMFFGLHQVAEDVDHAARSAWHRREEGLLACFQILVRFLRRVELRHFSNVIVHGVYSVSQAPRAARRAAA